MFRDKLEEEELVRVSLWYRFFFPPQSDRTSSVHPTTQPNFLADIPGSRNNSVLWDNLSACIGIGFDTLGSIWTSGLAAPEYE